NTSAELDALPFTGPDGTAASYYTVPGTPLHSWHEAHRWMQYKVYLATTDSAYTPVLQEVRITTTTSSVTSPISHSNASRVNLYQNFPNPVGKNSPSGQSWTTAAFDIRGNVADVVVGLYNMLGKKVRSLWNGSVSPGRHVVRINTRDLSSGTYSIRLTTRNASASTIISVLN
ncbi:MAG: T9SS type A sorting domain-containing protein, partial [Chlorobi bacterium]|nr:T9SS type A sorting domain-containing protein [Chlorobiota bacterium]